MAQDNLENVVGTLKRRHAANGDTEIAAEGVGCSLRGGADVSEESLSEWQKDVIKVAEKGGPLKWRHPVSGNTEIAVEDEDRSLGGVGGEEVSEESIAKLQDEVIKLAEKVAEYREQGPVAFAQLLEESLAQMRSSLPVMDMQINNEPTHKAESPDGMADEITSSNKDVLAQRTELLERLASAKGSVPTLLRDIKSCEERLGKAVAASKQSPGKTVPLHRAPV